MDKYDILRKSKTPIGLKKHIGIEIEFVSPLERDDIEDILCKMNLHANCTIKDDGSVDEFYGNSPDFGKHFCDTKEFQEKIIIGHDEFGPLYKYRYNWNDCSACVAEDNYCNNHSDCYAHELTILCLEEELKKILTKIGVFLKKCKAKVNDSCGLHVHLDMRNRDMKECTKRLVNKQKEFHKMVKKHRLNNSYCRPLNKEELKTKYPERYRDINLQAYTKFGTIEIRIHEGTVDVKEIYNWCKYLISVVENRKVSGFYVKKRIAECS